MFKVCKKKNENFTPCYFGFNSIYVYWKSVYTVNPFILVSIQKSHILPFSTEPRVATQAQWRPGVVTRQKHHDPSFLKCCDTGHCRVSYTYQYLLTQVILADQVMANTIMYRSYSIHVCTFKSPLHHFSPQASSPAWSSMSGTYN